MKTTNYFIFLIALLVVNVMFSQDYAAFYPADWDFKNNVDVIDVSQIKSITAQDFTIDDNKEYLVLGFYTAWNNTYQLTNHGITNHLMKDLSYDVRITYENANSNKVKLVTILNTVTNKPIEERYYTYGSFDVQKIVVKRHLLNITNPDVYEVVYEGNDDDFIMETIYTPEKTISKKTKRWYKPTENNQYQLVKKKYVDETLDLDQTDSLLLNKNHKIISHFEIVYGIASEKKYIYNTKQVEIYGELYNYDFLSLIKKDDKEVNKYEYLYDERGNWTQRKIYTIKNGQWNYSDVTKRQIIYR